jgi:NAD(P)H dehydrogenase (quinone)
MTEDRMVVAITGASGHLGRKTAELVIDRLSPADLVLLTRTPDALADLAGRGAVVRRADFDEPQSVREALAGVERMLLISAVELGHRVQQHRAAIDAARHAGVRHVLYTSIPNPVTENPAGVVPDHSATEEALKASGVAWTFLRNNLYAEYQVPTAAQAIATGQLVTNAAGGRTAYVSRDDCAAAAAAVLTSAGHEHTAYDITGPKAVSAEDVAALAGELGGKTVDVVHVDDDGFVAGLTGAGLPEEAARLFASFGASTRGGFLEGVSSAVQDLTGEAPRSLRAVLTAASGELVAA